MVRSFFCIGGAHLTNRIRAELVASYKFGDEEFDIPIGAYGGHCIMPRRDENLNATVYITPVDNYNIQIYKFPFTFSRSFDTEGGFGLTATDINTIVYIYRSDSPPLGGPGDGPTRIIDRMKINTLILGDSIETVISPGRPSEYSTTTNDTSTPFSAIFMAPIVRVTVTGRSRDHAFYVSMLVRREDDTYQVNVIDQHSTPELTLTIDTGDDRLFMLETDVSREWSVHTVIS